jgi:glycine cleavage system transcriptional repressor
MARFSLHTVGSDRPGIVAGVTNALATIGANLEDTQMTILRGQSAIVIVLNAPGISDGGLIEGALEHVAEELNLFVAVRPLPDEVAVAEGGEWYSILVDGADRPGIIAGVAEALLAIGGNIGDLSSRLLERDGRSGYVLRLAVKVPPEVSAAQVEQAVEQTSSALGISSSVSPGIGALS